MQLDIGEVMGTSEIIQSHKGFVRVRLGVG